MGSLLDPPAELTATSDFPELCVEWLPLHGPFTADGEWCDITAYVSAGSTFSGRQYELEQFQAGTCDLTLRSDTRLFDPEFTTGPFYPYLIPMRQVRVSAVWNSTRYPVWRGYITDWGQTIQTDDAVFETTIRARDAFALLELIELPSSAWALEVQKDGPTLWFRLGETDTVRVSDSSSGGNYGLYDNCEQGATGLVVNDADGACGFAHSLEERVYVQTTPISGYPFSVSAVINIDGSDPDGFKVIFAGYQSLTDRIVLSLTTDTGGAPGRMRAYINSGGTARSENAPPILADGVTHHLMWTFASASSWTFYVDGVAQTTEVTESGSPAWISVPLVYTIGNYPDQWPYTDYGFGTDDAAGELNKRGTIDEVCVWNGTTISATRAAAHSLAAKSGWDNEDSGARVTRFLDALNWPSTLRNISTGISTLGPASWSAGSSALSALQAWADTEYGMFFTDPQGRLSWYSRHRPYLTAAAVTSQATFGDSHSAATLKYHDIELVRDETRIRNPVTASRSGGISVTARDAAYEVKYGTRTWASPTTQDRLDSAVRDRATWLVERYKELGTRVSSVVIKPRASASLLWPQALGRAIGDRVTIKRTPLGTGNEISVDQIVEGVGHSFSPREWTTTFHCSPVDPGVGTYLILDDSTYGLLDTGKLSY